jgi:hypothetical protein
MNDHQNYNEIFSVNPFASYNDHSNNNHFLGVSLATFCLIQAISMLFGLYIDKPNALAQTPFVRQPIALETANTTV